jgi:hypothetical protein
VNLEKVYTDLSPEQRKAQTVPQPTGFTRLQTFYDKQDKDMTAQFVFGTMVEIATPILEAYHSDLYHDAIELKGRDWRKEQIFLYCVGKCGTNIVEKLTEAETLKKHGRENVFAFNYTRHPSLKKCFQLEVVKV